MKRYYITIIDLSTGSRRDYTKNTAAETIPVINDHLGGFNNIGGSREAQKFSDISSDYCLTGFTKDNTKAYSIICITLPE